MKIFKMIPALLLLTCMSINPTVNADEGRHKDETMDISVHQSNTEDDWLMLCQKPINGVNNMNGWNSSYPYVDLSKCYAKRLLR